MSCILAIETSTSTCSAALSVDGVVLFEKSSGDGPSHAALLGVYVEEAFSVLKRQALKPDAIAVSNGPGSYTGLRIGVSMAKGLCYGLGIPLLSIPTLKIMASGVAGRYAEAGGALYCPMLDARRMEVYAAIYDADLRLLRKTAADIVTADTYAPFLEKNILYFFGNGAAKCKEVIASPNARFMEDIHPLAVDMIPLAEEAFEGKQVEDLAYFEPFYLKEFTGTIAKNKLF
ncbi:MAG: tRNA (adenosine(37)-N6)-threonylcarbamoyltransferase complex dimerization subunit type 1 TsaB [Tannerellaceae bacterium]|jgi:tRNA threonylcarbamoyladenosine biosynthesis protein TsaB|nr:tRNA (adenosine(37)-N6)-threonylcarbamoyltransferase complex dimerization subunit type 1 TsaB [Tannerellaceae bacterium]